jgi:hypothetical protein
LQLAERRVHAALPSSFGLRLCLLKFGRAPCTRFLLELTVALDMGMRRGSAAGYGILNSISSVSSGLVKESVATALGAHA